MNKILKCSRQNNVFLFLTFLAYVCFAFFRLDTIPAEWFGDISIVNSNVVQILAGTWPFVFSSGGGPLYFYLISPIIFFTGISFMAYKVISVVVGLIGLVATYFFIKEVSNKRTATFSAFAMALSFWYVVWARMGNYNIMVPILSTGMMYYFIRFTKKENIVDAGLAALIASFGLFTYAGVFLLPIVLIVLMGIFYVYGRKKLHFSATYLQVVTIFTAVFLFATLVSHQLHHFTGKGYIGNKLFSIQDNSPKENISRLTTNIVRTLLMFHVTGDTVFRWNVPNSPHLDVLSGMFLVVGLIFFIFKRNKYLPYIIIPLVLLPIPSILPGHPPAEIPSSPRNMAIMPFIFFFVGYGIDLIFEKMKSYHKHLAIIVTTTFLVVIAALNLYKYFWVYPRTLPDKNTPFGKTIAEYVKELPANTQVILTTTGWGSWGQPEMDTIKYVILYPQGRPKISELVVATCADLPDTKQIVFINDPANEAEIKILKECLPRAIVEKRMVNGYEVFVAVYQE